MMDFRDRADVLVMSINEGMQEGTVTDAIERALADSFEAGRRAGIEAAAKVADDVYQRARDENLVPQQQVAALIEGRINALATPTRETDGVKGTSKLPENSVPTPSAGEGGNR